MAKTTESPVADPAAELAPRDAAPERASLAVRLVTLLAITLPLLGVVAAPFFLWGWRPYRSHDQSRNNILFGILALGEGWHNTHHAFPTSARHGLRWWQIDVSYWVIRGLALLRLAWDVRLPSEQARMNEQRAS